MVSVKAFNTVSANRFLAMAGAIAIATTISTGAAVQAQTPDADENPSSLEADPTTLPNDSLEGFPQVDPQEPSPGQSNDDLRPLAQGGSILSLQGGQRLMREAGDAVATQNYSLAINKYQEARQVFNQISNFYQELAASFAGIDNRIADSQRQLALETAQMRDQATYELALVHRAQNQPDLAVPLLVQIIRSQQPTRDLGQRAYRQLFELGFVDSPYPRGSQDSESTSSTSPDGAETLSN
ncbi:MAG: hypothetical protein VKK04_09605 [Synechococcales bacterium]|nr:hypothetical protein [Synechococcales bacterium]